MYRFHSGVNPARPPNMDAPDIAFAMVGVEPSSFAVDGTTIVVVDAVAGRAYARTYGGTEVPHEITPKSVLSLDNDAPIVLLDADHVNVGDTRVILRFARVGGSDVAEVLATLDDDLGAMTMDDRALYFTTTGDTGGPYAAVYRLAK